MSAIRNCKLTLSGIALLFLLRATAARADLGATILNAPPQGPNPEELQRDAVRQQQKAAYEAAQAEAVRAYNFALQQQQFMPMDPWREIDGKTNFAKGLGWKHFCGRVLEVQPGGIRIEGDYGEPLMIDSRLDREFFVAHFPYQAAEKETVSSWRNLTAFEAGTHTYTTTLGSSRTLRKLDYGTIAERPAWVDAMAKMQALAAAVDAQIAKRAAQQKQFEAERRAFQFYSLPATNGDAFAQFRLGEFYLNGRGTETNSDLARYWLTRAAGAGNADASKLLLKLRSTDVSTTAPP